MEGIDTILIETLTNLPIVAFAFYIYFRESKRVDRKDEELHKLVVHVTENMVKATEHIDRLAGAIDRLDASIDDLVREYIKEHR